MQGVLDTPPRPPRLPCHLPPALTVLRTFPSPLLLGCGQCPESINSPIGLSNKDYITIDVRTKVLPSHHRKQISTGTSGVISPSPWPPFTLLFRYFFNPSLVAMPRVNLLPDYGHAR